MGGETWLREDGEFAEIGHTLKPADDLGTVSTSGCRERQSERSDSRTMGEEKVCKPEAEAVDARDLNFDGCGAGKV